MLVTINPLVRFAYDNLSLHVALETAEALIGGLLAYLAVERFRTARLLRDAILAWTFSLLAATNLLLSTVPMVSIGARPLGALPWAVLGLRLFGAAGLCAAAFTPVSEAPRRRDPIAALAVLACVVVGIVIVASAAAGAWLADAVDPSVSPEASGRPRLVGHPVVLGVQVLGMGLYGAAAVGFRRQMRDVVDELLPWLAAGSVLAAFARLNFFLFPSLYSNWVYTGDILRLGSYLCFLVGAGRQIDAYRRDRTRTAVLDERQRVARDLHDGVVQELAFIRSQTDAMVAGVSVPGMMDVVAAAKRALEESRRAIDALTDIGDRSLVEVLRGAAADIATRAGVAVKMEADDVPDVPDEVRATLERVVREAVSNAVRHAGATSVTVGVTRGPGTLRVTVADDGRGFRLREARSGFGLRSMRGRVEDIGGQLDVRSSPGRGTVVEAAVPVGLPIESPALARFTARARPGGASR